MPLPSLKRIGLVSAAAIGLSIALGAALIVSNPPPRVPALPAAQAHAPGPPYVVKLHARWCPLCMTTRGVWSTIEQQYTGRVRFVVFDFTNDETTRASRDEARRIGLGTLFEEYVGETGTVLVVHGTSKAVIGDLHGDRDLTHYRTAIDRALQGAGGPS